MKLDCSFVVLLYEKYVPKILIASLRRSMHFIPQTANLIPFRARIAVVSHFVRFELNPEKMKKY